MNPPALRTWSTAQSQDNIHMSFTAQCKTDFADNIVHQPKYSSKHHKHQLHNVVTSKMRIIQQVWGCVETHFFLEPHLDVILMEKLHPPQQNAVTLHIHYLWDAFRVWMEKITCTYSSLKCLCLHGVSRSAAPCWVGFCRKVRARLWWPWWFCRRSFPAAEPQRRSATQLLHLQRVNTVSHTMWGHSLYYLFVSVHLIMLNVCVHCQIITRADFVLLVFLSNNSLLIQWSTSLSQYSTRHYTISTRPALNKYMVLPGTITVYV